MINRITAVLLTASLLVCFEPGNASGLSSKGVSANTVLQEQLSEEALSETLEEESETEIEGFFDRVRRKLSQAAGAVQDTAGKAADKVKETAGAAKEKAGGLLGAAGEKIGDLAGSVKNMAGEAAGKVSDAADSVADTASDAAGAVKDKAQELSDAAAEKTQASLEKFKKLAEKWRKVAKYLARRLEKTDITPEEWEILEEKYSRTVYNAYRAGWIGNNKSLIKVEAEADFVFKTFKYTYRYAKKEIGPSEYTLYMVKVLSRDGLPFGLAALVEKLTGVNAEQIAAGAGELAQILAEEIAAEEQ